jgi:hypothetical protein
MPTHKKKNTRWLPPQLIILSRGNSAEHVLSACKSGASPGGYPGAINTGCEDWGHYSPAFPSLDCCGSYCASLGSS